MHQRNIFRRTVHFANRSSAQVDLNHPLIRYSANPLITASDVNRVWTSPGLQVITVHNAAVTEYKEEFLMLFRSHLRCGISILGTARSKNGIDHWKIDPHPALIPAHFQDIFAETVNNEEQVTLESGGVEDPRITRLEDSYAITYSAYDNQMKNRVRVCLATTQDFLSFTRHGPMLQRDMRNVVIFPEQIHNRYVALFRPNDQTTGDTGGIFTQIRLGTSLDYKRGVWDIEPEPIMRTGAGPSSFSDKIGPGAPPVKTKQGWLSLFHGVRTTMAGNPYVLGVALHELHDPSRILMASIPVLFPSASDCRVAQDQYVHVPNVVFSCAMLRREDGTLIIYYGGNDTVMNCAATHEDVLIELCMHYGQDPLSGELRYRLQ